MFFIIFVTPMIEILQNTALEAGKAIMNIYQSDDFNIEAKGDGSPLTLADKAANDVIIKSLNLHFPEIPVLSEEGRNIPYAERKIWNQFFLVDPLDGTKEFIKRNGEFTVNIALILNGKPIAGVVFAPALGKLYIGNIDLATGNWLLATSYWELATGNWQLATGQQPIVNSQQPTANSQQPTANSQQPIFKIVASRSHNSPETEAFIEKMREIHGDVELVSMGSSLKICLVAEGKADAYPRLGPTMEWDTAAAHAIALAAGCTVLEHETQQELTYNKENLLNPWFIVTKKGF
jgi:3'(2'), 5'-bisphosphate nucleotidase